MIAILFLLGTVSSFRIFKRTRLKAELIRGIAGILGIILIGMFIFHWVTPLFLVIIVLLMFFLIILAAVVATFIDGTEKWLVLWKENSYWQRLVGNVSLPSENYNFAWARKLDNWAALITILLCLSIIFFAKIFRIFIYPCCMIWLGTALALSIAVLVKNFLFRK